MSRCLVSVRNRVAVEIGQVDPSYPKATTSSRTQVSSCNDFECFESVMGLGSVGRDFEIFGSGDGSVTD